MANADPVVPAHLPRPRGRFLDHLQVGLAGQDLGAFELVDGEVAGTQLLALGPACGVDAAVAGGGKEAGTGEPLRDMLLVYQRLKSASCSGSTSIMTTKRVVPGPEPSFTASMLT